MWRQPGFQTSYGSDYYNPATAGSKLAPKDKAMLHLVSHSLTQKSVADRPNAVSPRRVGSYVSATHCICIIHTMYILNYQHFDLMPLLPFNQPAATFVVV